VKKVALNCLSTLSSISSLYFICFIMSYIFQPELFLGLLVKAMKNDVMLKRVAAFAKRLLQVCCFLTR
jgi:hypothetical protein